MAATIYVTGAVGPPPTGIYQLNRGLIEDKFWKTFSNLEVLSQTSASPVIDAKLSGNGAPWADAASAPPLINYIANLLTAADAVDDSFREPGDVSAWATAKRKLAMDLLEEIVSGEIAPEDMASTPLGVVSDLDQDRHEDEIFVGFSDDWKEREEDREP